MYGLICSNTALNYLQTVYDFDTQTTKTAVKDKYSISKTKFDIINDINDNTIKRLALHANILEFTHPITKKDILIKTNIPKEFNNLI